MRPDIPWCKVRGISNVLRHEDHSLSDRIIRGVVVDEIPPLWEDVAFLLSRPNGNDGPSAP